MRHSSLAYSSAALEGVTFGCITKQTSVRSAAASCCSVTQFEERTVWTLLSSVHGDRDSYQAALALVPPVYVDDTRAVVAL